MPNIKKQLSVSLTLGLLVFLAACDGNRVFEPQKYNRDSGNYGKVITNRDGLVVCTTNAGKESKKIAYDLATKECAKFGKRALYQNYSVATCPLTTPSSWHYSCQAPQSQ
ncbi:MAG: hypothetical protein ACK5LE_00225 [Alphaproteobacteria bacterium]